MGRKKSKTSTISVRLPRADSDRLEILVEKGHFLTTTQAIRFATKQYLAQRKMLKVAIQEEAIPTSQKLFEAYKLGEPSKAVTAVKAER